MSLMRFSRSVPAPWMVRANSTCLSVRLRSGLSLELLAQDQDAVQRRAQLVRHVGEEFGLVLGGERQLGRLLLERAAGLLDLLVLALHLDVPLGQLLGLLLQLLVGLLQLLLLRLQLAGQLLRLLEQAFRLHRRLDAVEHDADAGGQLLQERQVRGVELVQGGERDHRLDLVLEHHREDDEAARQRVQQSGSDTDGVRRNVVHVDAPLFDRTLADEAVAERQSGGIAVALVVGVPGEQLQVGGDPRPPSPSGR